jgi:inhibitor of KinA
MSAWPIVPLGDRGLCIEVGQRVDAETSARARAVARALELAALPGVSDVVPTFTAVALHYRPELVGGETPFEALRGRVEAVLAQGVSTDGAVARVVEVPVCYDGPDLAEVATACNLTTEEVVALHVASAHVVHMLGFAPGFPYMGGLDARLHVPRRATPRTAVPAGSVAIARDQSGIYPLEAPGGWNLIGRTPLRLFDPMGDPPCLLAPGDEVRFVAISPQQFQALAESDR